MSDLVQRLDAPTGAGPVELGGAWDAGVDDACRAFTRLSDEGKAGVRRQLDKDRSWRLVSWAEHMASLAVRERSADRLVYGLVGLSLFDRNDFDGRDAAVLLPLFVRAARLLGEDPDRLLLEAAGLSDATGGRWLREATPAPAAAPLALHREVGEGGGFRFVREEVLWDPVQELAGFADDGPGARKSSGHPPS